MYGDAPAAAWSSGRGYEPLGDRLCVSAIGGMLEYPLCKVSTGLLMTCISFSAVRSRFVLSISCEYGIPSGRARSCLCRLRRHIRRAAMSMSSANPTAPIAMPTLAPVLRPLELLEEIDPDEIGLLADDENPADLVVDAEEPGRAVIMGGSPPESLGREDAEIVEEAAPESVGPLLLAPEMGVRPKVLLVATPSVLHCISIETPVDINKSGAFPVAQGSRTLN